MMKVLKNDPSRLERRRMYPLLEPGVGGYRAEFPGTSSPQMVRNCTGEILAELPDDYLGSTELVKLSPTYQKSVHHYLATD